MTLCYPPLFSVYWKAMDLISAKTLAEELLKEHELLAWHFCFDTARVRFGSCRYHTKTITLSKTLTQLNTEKIVKGVILHEIAHALVGARCGHGRKWKAKMEELGEKPERCFSAEQVEMPQGKYTAICPVCAYSFPAHRKRKGACRKCCTLHNGGKYSPQFMLQFQENEPSKKRIKRSMAPNKKPRKSLLKKILSRIPLLSFFI